MGIGIGKVFKCLYRATGIPAAAERKVAKLENQIRCTVSYQRSLRGTDRYPDFVTESDKVRWQKAQERLSSLYDKQSFFQFFALDKV